MKHAAKYLTAASMLLGFCLAAEAHRPNCRCPRSTTGGSRQHLVRGGRADPRDRLRERYGDLTRRMRNLRDRIRELQRDWRDTKDRWWRTANRMGDLTNVHAEWNRVDAQLRRALSLWDRLKNARREIKDEYNSLPPPTPSGGSGDSSGPTGTPGPSNAGSSGATPGTTGTPSSGGTTSGGSGTSGGGSTSGGSTPSGGGGTSPPSNPPPDIKLTVDDIGNALDLSVMMVDDPAIKKALQAGKKKFDEYASKYGWMLGGKKISLRASLKLLLSGKKIGIMDVINLFE